jgi:hypothetical protein
MRRLLLAVSIISIASGGAVALAQGTGYGQIAFDNRTSVTADAYLDDSYACRALAGLSCTTHAQAGTHIAEFRFVDGDVVTTDPFYLQEGDSIIIPMAARPAP